MIYSADLGIKRPRVARDRSTEHRSRSATVATKPETTEPKAIMKPTSADLRVSSSASSAIVEDETRTLSLLSLTLLGLCSES